MKEDQCEIDEIKYPKLLVVAANPFSSTNSNGKTIAALLRNWPRDKIAQVYSQGIAPEWVICDNYYRITDLEMVQCFWGLKKTSGVIFDQENVVPENSEINLPQKGFIGYVYRVFHSLSLKRWNVALLARDIYWKRKQWQNESLLSWLDKFSPEVVIVVCGPNTYLYKMSVLASERFNIPIVPFITDDYFTNNIFTTPFGWIFNSYKMHWFHNMLNQAPKGIAISPKMRDEFKKRFDKDFIFASNIPSYIAETPISLNENEIRMIYSGSLHTNRWKVMAKISAAIVELNDRENIKISLDIYGPPLSDKERIAILRDNFVKYKGMLSAEDLIDELKKGDIFVHVEAFDKKSVKATRLSLSTKIPEYLAMGGLVFIVGPSDVGSVEYLIDSGVALVVCSNNVEAIKDKLRSILADKKKYDYYSFASLMYARNNYDTNLINKQVLSFINESILEY